MPIREIHGFTFVSPAERGVATSVKSAHFTFMTKLAEIQDAILQLPPHERESLRSWIDSTEEETPEMLAAIDEGLRSLKEKGVTSIDDVRKKIPLWATKSA